MSHYNRFSSISGLELMDKCLAICHIMNENLWGLLFIQEYLEYYKYILFCILWSDPVSSLAKIHLALPLSLS